MIYILQLVFGILSISTSFLDYKMVETFPPYPHMDVYHYIAEYMEIAECSITIMQIIIGGFVEMQLIKTTQAKSAWGGACNVFLIILYLESFARLISLTVLATHVSPGALDFLGLFVLLIAMYYILKFTLALTHNMGLHDRIQEEKIPKEPIMYQPVDARYIIPSI